MVYKSSPKAISAILTERETQVIELVAFGNQVSAIAASLGITIGIVQQHINTIMAKLDTNSLAVVVMYAVWKNIVDPSRFFSE